MAVKGASCACACVRVCACGGGGDYGVLCIFQRTQKSTCENVGRLEYLYVTTHTYRSSSRLLESQELKGRSSLWDLIG